MNINDLTIGQAKELAAMFGKEASGSNGLNCMIGEKVIIRTYSAGVWFGELEQKDRNEVILKKRPPHVGVVGATPASITIMRINKSDTGLWQGLWQLIITN